MAAIPSLMVGPAATGGDPDDLSLILALSAIVGTVPVDQLVAVVQRPSPLFGFNTEPLYQLQVTADALLTTPSSKNKISNFFIFTSSFFKNRRTLLLFGYKPNTSFS